jgi:hypothetical protein
VGLFLAEEGPKGTEKDVAQHVIEPYDCVVEVLSHFTDVNY